MVAEGSFDLPPPARFPCSTLSKLSNFPKEVRAIAGLEITNDNYEVAVKILRDRFGDPQIVISGHYTKLMDLPSSMNQTPALRSTFDELEKHLRCLSSLGEDTKHRHFVSLCRKSPKRLSLNLKK